MTTKTTTSARTKRKSLPPEIKIERATVMAALQPVVQMLGGIVGPQIEIVLHDLTMPERSVVAIANGHVTGRALGSSVLSGPKDDKGFAQADRELATRGVTSHAIVSEYTTHSASGESLKSATVVFRDSQGEPFAALCLNADMALFEAMHSWLERILTARPQAPARLVDEAPELDTKMREIIDDAVGTFGKPTKRMSKEEKIYAVQIMARRGLFIVRGGVERAAAALGVTRFSIYNYLEELRRRNGEALEIAEKPAQTARGVRARKNAA